jgi:hypothetical protein
MSVLGGYLTKIYGRGVLHFPPLVTLLIKGGRPAACQWPTRSMSAVNQQHVSSKPAACHQQTSGMPVSQRADCPEQSWHIRVQCVEISSHIKLKPNKVLEDLSVQGVTKDTETFPASLPPKAPVPSRGHVGVRPLDPRHKAVAPWV